MKKSRNLFSSKFVKILFGVGILVLLMFSAIQVTSSDIDELRPGTTGTIMGVVKDAETDETIPDAIMTLKYHDLVRTTQTDTKGYYIFNDVPMCYCLKNVSAYKSGYEEQYKLVAVSEVTWVNFSLEPEGGGEPDPTYGMITGVVVDSETNKPLYKALITLQYHDTIRTEYTDKDGVYTFTDVLICNCTKDITASKRHYETQHKNVVVWEVTYVNFSLKSDKKLEFDEDIGSICSDKGLGETLIEGNGLFIVIAGSMGILCASIAFYTYHSRRKQ